MNDNRLPKQLFYGELSQGKRGTGRPKLRYKDSLKANLKRCDIDTDTWEKQAADRAKWRTTIKTKVNESEQTKRRSREEKRAAAKMRPTAALTNTSAVCAVCSRVCASSFGLRSHMKVHK